MRRSPDCSACIQAALPAQGRVLEIGCGDGALLSRLAASGRYALDACDVNPASAAAAAQASGVPVCTARAEALPYPDGAFDAAVLECVFSLCEPVQTVRELARVLAPGGRVILTDLHAPQAAALPNSALVRMLYPRPALEAFFAQYFVLRSFESLTHALRAHFAQLLMQGALCDCVDPHELPLLRAARPEYGLWIWTKR